MTLDLFSQAASAAEIPHRVVTPERELGAYEALWARQETGFKSVTQAFGAHAGAIRPTSFPDRRSRSTRGRGSQRSGRRALSISAFASTERPITLHDFAMPITLSDYFTSRATGVSQHAVRCSDRDTRASLEGKLRAAKLARLLVADGFTVVSGLARGLTPWHTRRPLRQGLHDCGAGHADYRILPTGKSLAPAAHRPGASGHESGAIVQHSRQDVDANSDFFPARNATMSP